MIAKVQIHIDFNLISNQTFTFYDMISDAKNKVHTAKCKKERGEFDDIERERKRKKEKEKNKRKQQIQ